MAAAPHNVDVMGSEGETFSFQVKFTAAVDLALHEVVYTIGRQHSILHTLGTVEGGVTADPATNWVTFEDETLALAPGAYTHRARTVRISDGHVADYFDGSLIIEGRV
jgi:hypothetical protein